jgi:hypothetical protein
MIILVLVKSLFNSDHNTTIYAYIFHSYRLEKAHILNWTSIHLDQTLNNFFTHFTPAFFRNRRHFGHLRTNYGKCYYWPSKDMLIPDILNF